MTFGIRTQNYKETAAKLQDDLSQTIKERDASMASHEAFEKDAEELVSSYQVKLADGIAENEQLAKQVAEVLRPQRWSLI